MVKFLRNIFRLHTLFSLLTLGAIVSLVLSYIAPYIPPSSLSLLPFFGLAHWLILTANLALCVFWALKKSKWSIAILLIIIAGGRIHLRTFSIGSDKQLTGNNELRVLSYNVHLFDLYNTNTNEKHKTKNRIIEYVKGRDPDIVCFQEFYQQDAPTSFVTKDTILKIMDTKYYHERFARKRRGRQNFGVAVFSKHPIIKKGNVAFEVHKDNYNYCIYADIVKGIDTFRVYNIHLQSIQLQKEDYEIFDTETELSNSKPANIINLITKIKKAYPTRAKQATLVQEHMAASPYNIIVCGDFNDTPVSYCYTKFSNMLTDAFRNASFGIGSTYAGSLPAMRIDYIFHSKQLGSRDFNIQKDKLSDHYAIDCSVFVKHLE